MQTELPPIKAEHQSLYPTMNSLDEVVVAAQDAFPAEHKNTLFAVLMTYHNTLLSQVKQ
jgi:hypothetical protein